MPSISDRLKALGVQIGSEGIGQPHEADRYALESILDGRLIENDFGETFVIESIYEKGYLHGNSELRSKVNLLTYSNWARDNRISNLSSNSFAFIDTETTGLSGGMGTYAFLVGIGRFEGDDFLLAQFFMRDPSEEPAQLYALEQFLCKTEAIVTYNGKTFDIPLLNTRYLNHGWQSPFNNQPHIDLLHLARKLWSDRLPSRALGNIEYQILNYSRTEEDIPGWAIPAIYFDFLRSGDARPLKSVFYHNAMDILSLAALFTHTTGILANPTQIHIEHGVDVIALGKLFEDIGETDTSIDLFIKGLEHDLPESTLIDGLRRLAKIHKRNEEYSKAVYLWEWAAAQNDLESHIELAKFFEHKTKDYRKAIDWTTLAINLILEGNYPIFVKNRYFDELTHRISRLEIKLQKSKD